MGRNRRIWGQKTLRGERARQRGSEREREREREQRQGYYIISTFFPPPVMFYLTGSPLQGGKNDKSNPKCNSLCSVQRAHSVLYSP